MRLDCPSCAANYDIPDHLLKPGRRMRCARCGAEWLTPALDAGTDELAFGTVAPAEAEPVREAPPPIEAPVVAPLAKESSEPTSPSVALLAAWGVSIIALLGGVTGLIVWRRAIAAAWPPAERLLGGG
jgi:predicted Zn finger-like uncharacterized protein